MKKDLPLGFRMTFRHWRLQQDWNDSISVHAKKKKVTRRSDNSFVAWRKTCLWGRGWFSDSERYIRVSQQLFSLKENLPIGWCGIIWRSRMMFRHWCHKDELTAFWLQGKLAFWAICSHLEFEGDVQTLMVTRRLVNNSLSTKTCLQSALQCGGWRWHSHFEDYIES